MNARKKANRLLSPHLLAIYQEIFYRLIISISLWFLCPSVSVAQVYQARTDLNVQSYPASIPCPGSSCAGGGALVGAGTVITPSDFNTAMVRATDANTATLSPSVSFISSIGGTAETNEFDTTDTRAYFGDVSGLLHFMSINPAVSPPATSVLYGNLDCGGPYISNFFFSFTQPQFGYASAHNAAGNVVICSVNVSSSTTQPTLTNGNIVQLFDLSNCVGTLANVRSFAVDDVTVSADDQTFLVMASDNGGSNTYDYLVVWNRTNGCRYWNTTTGAVSGAWGVNGTIDLVQRMYGHDARISKDGNWVLLTSVGNYLYMWNIFTTHGRNDVLTSGHTAIGYNHAVQNSTVPTQQSMEIFPVSTDASEAAQLWIGSQGPAAYTPCDNHIAWSNASVSDNTPVFTTSVTSQFAATHAWENEIDAFSTNGSGIVYRFGHTYSSTASQFFAVSQAIGSVSQDGKYFIWTTDWDGMLGNVNGASAACTIGKDCRADVFIMQLPIVSSTPLAPTNLRTSVN
jgi:hypothetical protein